MKNDTKWEYFSVRTPTVVGRHSSSDIVLNFESVSSRHARIIFIDGDFTVIDLQATNGTRINGEKITEAIIHDGDFVAFGMENYLVKISEKPLPCLYHPETDKTYAIGMFPFYMGRGEANQLIVNDSSVSTSHAILDCDNDVFSIRDLNSTNGTRVNSQRIKSQVLQDGDMVAIGKWKVYFLYSAVEFTSFSLRFLGGERNNEVIPVQKEFSIGRSENNTLILNDTSISNQNSVIYWKEGRYWIKDCQSRNGTRVSGVNVQNALLKHGVEILVGRQAFLFFNPNLSDILFSLVRISGPQGGEEISLTKDCTTVGFDSRWNIVVKTKGVSKLHAEIVREGKKFYLKDLNSTNGSFVNKERIERIALNHGDELQFGFQKFIFRDASMERPSNLREETFSLLPMSKGRYGQPIELGNTCTFGSAKDNTIIIRNPRVLAHHAQISKIDSLYVLQVTSDFACVYLNDEMVQRGPLEHGDEIRIENCCFVFKSNLRPLFSDEINLPKWFVKGAIFIACVLVLLIFSSFFWSSSMPIDVITTAEKDFSEIHRQKDEKCLNNFKWSFQQQVRNRQYAHIIDNMLGEYKTQAHLESTKNKLAEIVNPIIEVRQSFQKFINFIQKVSTPISVIKDNKEMTFVNEKISNQGVVFTDNENTVVFWEDVSHDMFYDLLEKSGFVEQYPLECAGLARLDEQIDLSAKYLAMAWNKTQQGYERMKISDLYAKMKGIPTPLKGFIVVNGKFLTLEEKEQLDKEELARLEEEKKRHAEEMLRKKQEEEETAKKMLELEKELNKEAEKHELALRQQQAEEEFEMRYTIIDEHARTYSYRKAIEHFEELKKDLISKDKIKKIDERIQEIKPLQNLFTRLIRAINKNKLKNNEVKFGKSLIGIISKANEEQFIISIRGGTTRGRWASLSPAKMIEFLRQMYLSAKDTYFLGVFCLQNGLLKEGNELLIDVWKKDKKMQQMVNRFLAKFLEIEMPKEGFVPYNGLLISKNEREQRAKGLVRYRGEWVTPEEKEMLESGFIFYDGKWITEDEKKLQQKGYIKYKGKWYTSDDLAELRKNWEDAWEGTTAHYLLKTNVSQEFLEEMKIFMEAAYIEYAKFFEKKVSRAMQIYAFRTFEDYRKYCLEFGNADLVKAGGFAENRNFRGVSYPRPEHDLKGLLSTIIHEGSHVYHYLAAPQLRAPSWFAEAVATQFEGFIWDGKTLTVNYLSQSRFKWIKSKIQEKGVFSLHDMMSKNAIELINENSFGAMTFYSQSWGIYYYLNHTPIQNYRTKFQLFVRKMNNGEYMGQEDNAFLSVFENDLPNLEKNWKEYILNIK